MTNRTVGIMYVYSTKISHHGKYDSLHSITQIIYDGTFCCWFSQNSIFMFFLLNTFLNWLCLQV